MKKNRFTFSFYHSYGFTLIEILVVLLILSVVSMSVVPTFFRSMEGISLKSAVHHVGDMLNFCRSMAVSDGQPFRLNYDEEQHRFWISYEKDPLLEPGYFEEYGVSGFAHYILPEHVTVKSFFIEETSELEIEETFVEFQKDGSASEVIIVFSNPEEDAYSIQVSELTGRIRIVDYEIEIE